MATFQENRESRVMEIVSKSEPSVCLYCSSDNIEAQSLDGSSYYRKVNCWTCDRHWYEVFNFDCVLVPGEYVEDVS